MKKSLIIHEGFTNNYLIPGIFSIVVGLFSILFLGIYSLPLIVLGFVFVSGSNGLEINLPQQEFRKYGSFGGIRIGKWKSYRAPIFAKLVLSSENATVGGMSLEGFLIPNKGRLKSLTYDIYLDTENDGWIGLYDFLEYETAKKALREINAEMKIPIKDKVREKLIENRKKRNSRR